MSSSNDSLHLTSISLRSIAAGELIVAEHNSYHCLGIVRDRKVISDDIILHFLI
jgi:hypothetical protein